MDHKREYGFFSEQDQIFPPMVVVEITNVCNSECIHCPHALISKKKDYQPKHMQWELYEKIVEEVSEYKDVIFRLLCDGEPLTHPRFLDMLRFAKARRIAPMNFITNGSLLDAQLAEAILEIGIEAVEISLDAFTKTTYEKIRRGLNYDLVMSNVHKFIALRNEMKARTKIMVSIIDQPEAQPEIDLFMKYWAPKVDRVITRIYTSVGGLVDEAKMKIDVDGERWPCPQLWRRTFINVDGFAEFCVEDWHDQTVIGDVNKTSIQEIWTSPGYQKLRSQHLSKDFQKIPYCSRCRDWKARDWNYNYFYALEKLLKL